LIVAVVLIHLILLHEYGSNNPLGVVSRTDTIPFYLYYIIKDLYSWILLILFIILLVFFNSNYYGHPDNYIPGDFMVTPTQIVPEWYFLSLYAILRSVPSKLGGLLVLVVVFIFLIFLPYLIGIFQVVRNTNFKPFNKYIMPIFF